MPPHKSFALPPQRPWTAQDSLASLSDRLPLPADPEERRLEANARRRARRIIREGFRLMGVKLP